MHAPRLLLARTLLLDWLGQGLILLILAIISHGSSLSSKFIFSSHNILWIGSCFICYSFWGWLFGAYSVIRYRRIGKYHILRRLLLTALSTILSVAIIRWLLNVPDEIWILHRRSQIFWMLGLTIWTYFIRLAVTQGQFLPIVPKILVLCEGSEVNDIGQAWSQLQHQMPLQFITLNDLKMLEFKTQESVVVYFSAGEQKNDDFIRMLEDLESINPQLIQFAPLLNLFEEYQQRIPPNLLPSGFITYASIPSTSMLNIQIQLKRLADVVISLCLLLITFPIILVSSVFIWLEDKGPVLFTQQRTGLLGHPFHVLKLRTMSVQPINSPAEWTQLSDRRVTNVGRWLRSMRIDELPQLLNVIKGEMSLIGPRPERPEMDVILAQNIPHYLKRYWMRPGLSGWAQICSSYASSIEESNLKISFDLFYLKRFSVLIDFIILFRTIKTILKATGR